MQITGFAAGPYKTNCYLVVNEGKVVIVDPGMHTHDKVVEFITENGVAVDKIVLTHGHIDHTRDAGQLAQRFGVPVYLHPDDAFMLDGGRGVSPQAAVLFDAANMTPVRDLRELTDGQTLALAGVDFTVRHAPGHSPGSVILVNEQVCLAGDVLFQGSIGRTDLPDSDPAAMQATLSGPVLAMADEVRVLPGHGGMTTMRAERAANPFLQGLTPA